MGCGADHHTIILDHIFNNGVMGVDLFFIISGFIMVYITQNNDGSWDYLKKFFIKRLIRIWPVYVILTLFIAIPSFDFEGLYKLFLAFIFYPNDYPPLKVGWTLNYEMYFYLIFGLSLLGKGARWWLFSTIIFATLIYLPHLYANHISFSVNSNYNFTGYLKLITNPIIWDFVAGIMIAKLYLSSFKINNSKITFLSSIACIFCIAIYYLIKGEDIRGIMGYGFPLALLVLILTLHFKNIKFKCYKWLIWLGDISYSLYLSHPLAVRWCHHIGVSINNPYIAIIATLSVLIPLSLFIASISHELIEVKLCNYIKTKILAVLDTKKSMSWAPPTPD
jgi:exopolysaccharide production protein ExoZ